MCPAGGPAAPAEAAREKGKPQQRGGGNNSGQEVRPLSGSTSELAAEQGREKTLKSVVEEL